MKIGVMTGIDDLDLKLQNTIKEVTIACYPEYFYIDVNINIAIVSPVKKMKINFIDFLYELRKRNIRVIVLLENEQYEYISQILSLGITDILFDPITIDNIVSKIRYATPFSDIVKYYNKDDDIYTSSTISKEMSNKEYEQTLKVQIINLFSYFNKKVNPKLSINQLIALLESEIIKKDI